ncbi:arsenite efflux ATP-binding protein ArsA [Alteribacillus persepolensis]|uniref:Arsenite efflux ATP-binding protein ArsA n=1 Tax=Alteribacillus persepolensis TaxID=568899 RepID=A0A1G8GNT1_9BACI|nr:arsenical pump-driving ATPase [Alteribacillus persepolensis]SDH96044.1 arsenite efflux ATP-binding protein ArsA [Alteribacillus persepolensis]
MRFQREHLPHTKHLFFTGKGGAGKTSAAAASAISLAESGCRVLIVSTDPASNLQDVFHVSLSNEQTPVPGINGLYALNIDPEEAARVYRENVVGPYRGKLPDAAIKSMEEQLSGACTVEIAAFDEFTRLLAAPDVENMFDFIIFDTAPTGHTLRLLQLPTAWSDFLDQSTHGASCLGPVSGLQEKEKMYQQTVRTLSDSQLTSLFLIARPEESSLAEAGRASAELKELGISNQFLLLNGVHPGSMSTDSITEIYIHQQQEAIRHMPEELKGLQQYRIPLLPYNIEGMDGLRLLLNQDTANAEAKQEAVLPPVLDLPSVDTVVDDLIQRDSRFIMTMGKGGVGKTSMAALIAVKLAERGFPVHLTTTDPANHLQHSLKDKKLPALLTISSIDPDIETTKYKEDVLSNVQDDLDQDSLLYLQEDLDSPCTEEIAIFHAFAKTAARAKSEFVVLDTAPTGHTLLLLDAAQSFHHEVLRSQGELPSEVKRLLPRLRNRQETSVLIMTLPETTPVLEAERLEADLLRADIQPAWWVINHSFLAARVEDPILQGRARQEAKWIERVHANHPHRTSLIPYQPIPRRTTITSQP